MMNNSIVSEVFFIYPLSSVELLTFTDKTIVIRKVVICLMYLICGHTKTFLSILNIVLALLFHRTFNYVHLEIDSVRLCSVCKTMWQYSKYMGHLCKVKLNVLFLDTMRATCHCMRISL